MFGKPLAQGTTRVLLVKMQGGLTVLGQKEGFSLGLGGLIILNRLLHAGVR